MAQPRHIKTFVSPGAVAGRTLVTFGAADGEVVTATAATDTLIGVAERIGSRDNNRVDVVVGGIADAVAGGNITRGDILTTNASGKAITASAGDRVIGIAMVSAVADDHIDVLIAQG